MPFLVDVRNAFFYLIRGEWREFIFRLRVYLGVIDLKNVSTGDLGLSEKRSYEYNDSGGLHLEKVLKSLKITPQDSIVDFGSGKGGALITFSKFPFSKITGIDLSPKLVAIAEKNLKKLNIRNIQMVVCDAVEFTDLEEYNYFYFFNPFPGNIMRVVIENIESSLKKKPRKVTIIYFNPEHHDTVITDSLFAKIDEFDHYRLRYFIYSNVKS
jgi:SAM-dependent methyltransferase